MEISTAVAPPEGSHHDTRRENWDTTLPHQLSIYGRKNDHHKIISTLNLTSHYQHISCTRQLPEEGNTFGGRNCQPQWYQKLIIRHREKSHYFNQHSQQTRKISYHRIHGTGMARSSSVISKYNDLSNTEKHLSPSCIFHMVVFYNSVFQSTLLS